MRDEVDLRYCFIIIKYGWVWLRLCGHRRKSVPGDDIIWIVRVAVCFVVVVHAELCCTTSSIVDWVCDVR